MEYTEVNVVCPYFKAEKKHHILCESPEDGLRRCPYRRKHRRTVYCHGCKYEHYTHCHIVLYTDKVIYQTMAEGHNKEG